MKEEIKDLPLQIFEIKAEAMVPCSLVFKIMAKTPEEAMKMVDKQQPTHNHPHLLRKKINSMKVFKPGTLTVLATKNVK